MELTQVFAAAIWREPHHVTPPEALSRRVRIPFVVAEFVMLAMHGHPHQGRSLAGQSADERQQPAHGLGGGEAAVREIAVITERDAHRAREPAQEERQRHSLPGKAEQCRQRTDVQNRDPQNNGPVEPALPAILPRFGLGGLGCGARLALHCRSQGVRRLPRTVLISLFRLLLLLQ